MATPASCVGPFRLALALAVALLCCCANVASGAPIVVNTWPFRNATAAGWAVIARNGSALDAVESGCSVCEVEQCDGTVGYGGSPDSIGETTLDAMIMDGASMDTGAVGDLRRIKAAISVARGVMEYTGHSFMAGDSATAFAVSIGFVEENLHTPASIAAFDAWRAGGCQPNFYRGLVGVNSSCPPYPAPPAPPARAPAGTKRRANADVSNTNHDTIGMLAIDAAGNIAAGTSTNGANHKVAVRGSLLLLHCARRRRLRWSLERLGLWMDVRVCLLLCIDVLCVRVRVRATPRMWACAACACAKLACSCRAVWGTRQWLAPALTLTIRRERAPRLVTATR